MSFGGLKSWFLSLFGYDKPEQERKTAAFEQTLQATDDALKRQERAIRNQVGLVEELRTNRETGIWPQDMIRGTYRHTNPRKIRRGHS
jgi:hypothetical protein